MYRKNVILYQDISRHFIEFLTKDIWNFIIARIQESEFRMKQPPAKNFQDLVVWQKAHQFVWSVYQYSDGLVKSRHPSESRGPSQS